MAIFRSKQAEDIDALSAKLADARRILAAAEHELSQRVPEIILNDDASTLATLRARVTDAGDRVALVELAHRSALQRERERLAEARLRARKSELRAFQQHAGALQRATDEWARTAAELQGRWNAIVDASDRALKLLPPNAYQDYALIFPRKLADLCELELARLGRRGQSWGPELFGHSAPGSMAAAVAIGTLPTALPPMSDSMREALANYLATFRAQLSLAPEPAHTSAPAVPAEPEPPIIDPDVGTPAELAAAAIAINAPVTAVAGAEPAAIDPYQPGDPQYEDYQAALAETLARTRPVVEPIMELSENV